MPSEPISFDILNPEPLLIVISGPSGVGKDAVLKALKKRSHPFHFVVTCASRPPRSDEKDGVDYHFVTIEKFERMIAEGELLEYANVYHEYKGIPKFEIRAALASKKDSVVRVDVQGAASIHSLCPDAVLIFLIPGSYSEWYHRLCNRETETPESLKIRLEAVRQEMRRVSEFDYVVVNPEGRLEQAVDTIMAIVKAEHQRIPHRRITL